MVFVSKTRFGNEMALKPTPGAENPAIEIPDSQRPDQTEDAEACWRKFFREHEKAEEEGRKAVGEDTTDEEAVLHASPQLEPSPPTQPTNYFGSDP